MVSAVLCHLKRTLGSPSFLSGKMGDVKVFLADGECTFRSRDGEYLRKVHRRARTSNGHVYEREAPLACKAGASYDVPLADIQCSINEFAYLP